MARYYFATTDGENCFPIDHFRDEMRQQGITEMQVYPAKIQIGEDYFFCQEFGEPGLKGEGCGKDCESYDPRNGKNGRCRYSANCYEPEDKPVTIKYRRK